MYTIEKHTGSFGRDKFRMHIKEFKHTEEMYGFLNKQSNNNWTVSNKGLRGGTYAYVGQQWHNVKSLDASILSHI